MTTEKTLELSTQILCALINQGFLPPASVGTGADLAARAVHDYLHSVAKEVKAVYERFEGEV